MLSDKEKRELYDRYGKEGLQAGGFQAHDPFEFFSSMFGGAGGGFGGPISSLLPIFAWPLFFAFPFAHSLLAFLLHLLVYLSLHSLSLLSPTISSLTSPSDLPVSL